MLEKEISLVEALTGTSFSFTHLDGRHITISSEPDTVIKPDDLKTVDGLGMPFHKKSFMFGNLFILFKVRFPSKVG